MREEPCDLDGTCVVLEHPRELAKLRAPLSRLVSPRLAALFRDPPAAFARLAEGAAFAPLARWLRAMGEMKGWEIGIYQPGARFADLKLEVYLQRPSSEASLLLSGGVADVPAWCPASLRETLRAVGVVRQQYNTAGVLLAPSDQQSLPSLHEEHRDMWFGDPHDSVDIPPRPEEYRAFYLKTTGCHFTANPRGDTWECSYVGGHRPGPPLDDWLTTFFERGPFGPEWHY